MPHPTEPAVVRHPELAGVMVALDPAEDYDANDALVKTYPQFFAVRGTGSRVIESVEVATAAPGEKRSRSRK